MLCIMTYIPPLFFCPFGFSLPLNLLVVFLMALTGQCVLSLGFKLGITLSAAAYIVHAIIDFEGSPPPSYHRPFTLVASKRHILCLRLALRSRSFKFQTNFELYHVFMLFMFIYIYIYGIGPSLITFHVKISCLKTIMYRIDLGWPSHNSQFYAWGENLYNRPELSTILGSFVELSIIFPVFFFFFYVRTVLTYV